ncbi:MAG: 30S ribosomal protein S6 [Desulfatiglandales bacterium]
MRHYETIYIANPNLTQDEYREVLDRYTGFIERNKGVLIKTEEWGIQRLAYEVKKFDKGGYVLMDYCGNPGLSANLERDLSLDDRILKFQTIKIAHEVDPQTLLQKQEEKAVKQQAPAQQEKASEGLEAEAEQSSERPGGGEKDDA